MINKNTQISIVLPCFNEEAQIEQTVHTVHQWLKRRRFRGEIIVVNNGSTDRTAKILNRISGIYKELVVVTNKINLGYGGSILTGCDAAKMDVVAYMDSDGQYDINDLDLLIPHLRSVDFVSGIRNHRADHFMRKCIAFIWNMLVRVVFGIRAKDIDCSMKIFKRSIWPSIRPSYGTGNLFSMELFLRLKRNRISTQQSPISHFPRLKGEASCINIPGIIHTFIQLLTLVIHLPSIPEYSRDTSHKTT